jgi:tetratricopeptide (TPR) repeat protein
VQAKQGQEIMTVGASTYGSQGLWSWGDGKVRNIVDSVSQDGKVRRIESNMAINSGNSGGPTINSKGEVVGVNYAYMPDAAAVSYHIDLGELNSFLALALPLVDPKDAAAFLSRADHRLAQGRYAVARDDYTSAIRLNPESAQAHLGRGKAHYISNDAKAAIVDLDQAIKLAPEYQQAFYFRGEAKFRIKDYDPAIEDFTQAVRLNPKSSLAFNARGCCFFAQQKWSEAEEDFGRSVELNPTASHIWQNRGLAREKLGKLDDALADMVKGTDTAPRNPRTHFMLGEMLHRAERYEAAIKAYDQADTIEQRDNKVQNPIYADYIGRCFQGMKKYENAIKLYNIAMEWAEKYAGQYQADVCLRNRGFCHRRLENFQASLADHNRSLKINPNNAETYYQRAWTYRALGQWDRVQEDFEKAISLDPDYAKKEAPIQSRSFYPGIRR